MKTYRELIRDLATLDWKEPVSNKKEQHVADLLHLFFEMANRNVKIMAPTLGSFFDRRDVVDAMKHAVGRRVSFDILLQEAPSSSIFYDELLKCWPSATVCLCKSLEIEYSFCVVDEKLLRFERLDVGEACACLNDPTNAKKLSLMFDDTKSRL